MSSLNQEPGLADNLAPRSTNSNDKHMQLREKINKKLKKILYKMLNLLKEIIIMSALASVYSAFIDIPPKISKSPAAYPFFPLDSPVTDWYRGEISKAIEQARSNDIAFVMFYAPWDAQSQSTRKEFNLAAKIMQNRVNFIAVNCWQPGSECKNQYSKVYRWPVLIAYPSFGRGIQYNGALKALHMLKFLNNLCQPLVVPQRIDELMTKHDAVILGQLNALPGSRDYTYFYIASLRYLERDPYRDVAFAILPQSPQLKRQITMYLWNETRVYNEKEWSSETLINWIVNNLHRVNKWISLSGMKSLSLAGYLQSKPTLILFSPRNPLLPYNYYYSMLKEVVLEYHNCNNDETIKHRQILLNSKCHASHLIHREMNHWCNNKSLKTVKIITNLPKIWTNVTTNNVCTTECVYFQPTCNENKIPTSMLVDLNKDFIKNFNKDKCKIHLTAHKYGEFVYNIENDSLNFTITGLACKTNNTLGFIALDSLKYYHFAEKLGVDLLNSSDKTVAVIIDEKAETHYVLEEKVTKLGLRLMIYNYTNGLLNRALSSPTLIKSKSTHSYPQIILKNNSNFFIEELNTKNFLSKIMQQNKVVLVFYYSKQCAFCSGISHIFLTTAKIFYNIRDIEFTRIEGDLNLLPWEYTMESYPTILLVPSIKKSESRVFPQSLPITVPNLIGFILTNMEPKLKLYGMWTICNQHKFHEEKKQCMKNVRYKTLSMIEDTLKQYRKTDGRDKAGILYKLQILRQIHLLLAHSSWKLPLIQQNFIKLNSHKDIKLNEKTIPKKEEL